MNAVDEFNELKERIKLAEREAEQAKGQLKLFLKTLKDEFNCNSLEEGEALCTKESRELQKLESKLERLLTQFKEKWDDKLG